MSWLTFELYYMDHAWEVYVSVEPKHLLVNSWLSTSKYKVRGDALVFDIGEKDGYRDHVNVEDKMFRAEVQTEMLDLIKQGIPYYMKELRNSSCAIM